MGRFPVSVSRLVTKWTLPRVALFVAVFLILPGSPPRFLTVGALSLPLSPPRRGSQFLYEDDNLEKYTTPQLGKGDLTKLKAHILQSLGFTTVPDATKMNVSQDEYEKMYKVYLGRVAETRLRVQQQDYDVDDDDDDEVSDDHRKNLSTPSKRFYSFSHNAGLYQGSIDQEEIITWLYFPVAFLESSLDGHFIEVDHATVRVLAAGLDPKEASLGETTVMLDVYQVVDSRPGTSTEGRLLLERKAIHLVVSTPKWIEIDVTSAVKSWVNVNSTNLGLVLECQDCVRRGLTLVPQGAQSLIPVLNVITNIHVGRIRDKRSTEKNTLDQHTIKRSVCRKDQRCCRHTLEVVFKDLEGFDFIVQPKKFDAGYCKGKCPPRFNPANHHALIQSLIWKKNRKRAPKICCAPHKLSDLEILHRDENDPAKLKVTKLTQMSVVDCVCT